jgi:dUTPase
MFKRTIKLRIHNKLCDIRGNQLGNWIDVCANGNHKLIGLKLPPVGAPTFVIDNVRIPLGISMTLPKWYKCELKLNNTSFINWGIIMTNAPGEIEYDYKYEYQLDVIAFKDITIPNGKNIAQIQFSLRPDAPWYMKIADLFISGFKYKEVDVLTTTRKSWGSIDKINFNTQNLLLT